MHAEYMPPPLHEAGREHTVSSLEGSWSSLGVMADTRSNTLAWEQLQ